MNQKERFLSIFRSLLTAVGSYLVGKFLFGDVVDNDMVVGWVSVVVTAGSVVWGILDKTATLEMVQSGFRSFFTVLGEIIVGAGIVNDQVLEQFLMIGSTAIPMLYSETAKRKNVNIAKGDTKIADLSGVKPEEGITPDTTPVKTK